VRPLLGTRRAEVEAYLNALGQDWREDSSNRHMTFTRNRIRHELVPLLEGWNPKLKEHLAQMAELARDEESWWEGEVARAVSDLILAGRPVRGGGRAAAEGLALDLSKLVGLETALQRRVVRHAVERLGAGVDFSGTEKLRELALTGRAGQKCELAGGLRAERSHRELRLSILPVVAESVDTAGVVEIPVPGEGLGFGVRVRIELESAGSTPSGPALLRNWKAGDRVHLRHSSGPRKVKEVLERMKVSGADRVRWPVLELNGRIVAMQGAAVEPEPGVRIAMTPLGDGPSGG
jgi:tRNA(Ile)-lysidine synthase